MKVRMSKTMREILASSDGRREMAEALRKPSGVKRTIVVGGKRYQILVGDDSRDRRGVDV